MKRCQYLLLLISILAMHSTCATPIMEADTTKTETKPLTSTNADDQTNMGVIIEDIIPDVENTTQKVIRVNPLELPARSTDNTDNNEDSSLYKIQSLKPPNRRYVNTEHMRGTKKRTKDSVPSNESDTPIIRQVTEPKFRKPGSNKKQHIKFIYNQNASNGEVISKIMRVHLTPGAYPVYYVLSKTNGRFGKHPIKSFRTPTEFLKYVSKNKVTPRESVA